MKRAEIEEQDRFLLRLQHDFRRAADIVTDALMTLEEVEAVAVIGSVAKPLWKEVPRFRAFRRAGIEVWHECKDLDLAVWISSQHRLDAERRARDVALHKAYESGAGPGTVGHQVEIFFDRTGNRQVSGAAMQFQRLPQGKASVLRARLWCIPFNKHVDGFVPRADLLASAAYATLYRRGVGRLRSALDLPKPDDAEAPSDPPLDR